MAIIKALILLVCSLCTSQVAGTDDTKKCLKACEELLELMTKGRA